MWFNLFKNEKFVKNLSCPKKEKQEKQEKQGNSFQKNYRRAGADNI